MDWKEFKEFKGIDLNDSFVIEWSSSNNELTFKLEASIWPESEYYQKPNSNEYTCYKTAELKFSKFVKLTGLKPMNQTNVSKDPDGAID